MNEGMRIEKITMSFVESHSKIRRWGYIRSEKRVLGNGSTKVHVLLRKSGLEELFYFKRVGLTINSSTIGIPNTCSFNTLVICIWT